MIRSLSSSALAVSLLAASPVLAAGKAVPAPAAASEPGAAPADLSLQGGQAESGASKLAMGGGFVTGLLSYSSDPSGASAGVGLLGWGGGRYQVSVSLRPSLLGGWSSEVGASAGAAPGVVGTSYGLHVGTGWNEGLAVSAPGMRAGLNQVSTTPNDVSISFTVNHALTSGLSVMGAAEARHEFGVQADGTSMPKDFVIGAGLGLRF